jgi:arylsulfatase A-like enzyme
MKRPNILILYPDQLRADAIGCAGNPCIKTPNIDRLSYEGVYFERAYNAYPLCCPFRASLLTGKYPHSHGLHANHHPVPLDQDFLAEILQDAGYRTGYIGKWHLDGGPKHSYIPPGPRRMGFERFIGFNRGHEYFGSIYYRDSEQPLTSKRYEPDFQTDHLLEFLEDCGSDPQDRPFFAEICYSPPHPPLEAPPHYLNLYSPDEVPIRPNVPDDPEVRKQARNYLARYYGLTTAVDHNIGKVLDWLDKKGLADDTVVIFLSDHGDMVGEHGLYAKKTYHEAAMHVPLIVRYPKRFPGGRRVSSLVDPSVDTMPTLLELCGIDVPEAVQGVSYLPLLEGGTGAVREAVFYEICKEREGPERFPVPERGVRTTDWLYVRNEQAAKVLFDLNKDPLETNNLVDSLAHRPVIEWLDGMLQEHMQNTNDDWKAEAVFPPPDFVSHEQGHEVWKQLLERAVLEA